MLEKQNVHKEEGKTDGNLANGILYMGNKGPCLGARHVVIFILSIGTSISFATRSIFSIVLVAMTTNDTSSNPDIPTYDWDNKGTLLSAIIWLGIPVQLVAGFLAKRYGHKWFTIGAVIVGAVFFMFIPLFASVWGSTGVMICRIIQGGANGMLYPIATAVHGIWVPVEERSIAGMISLAGGFTTTLLSVIGSGLLAESFWGYPGICYVIGSISILWCVLWIFLGYQSPATHPRITPEEKMYIETSLNSKTIKDIPVPWVKLLTSVHFWAPVIAAIGTNWIETIMSTVNIIYITKAWDIDVATGTLTLAIGPIVGVFFGAFLAPLSDFLVKKKYLRMVNARRLFHTLGVTGSSLCLLWMTWIAPGSMVWIIINLCISNLCNISYALGGAGINILDIAPTFAGIILGFANTFSQCFALLAPLTVDWIVDDETDRSQWRIIFLISGGIAVGSTILFDIFATDKRKWDNLDEERNEK